MAATQNNTFEEEGLEVLPEEPRGSEYAWRKSADLPASFRYAAKGFPSDKIGYTKKVNQFEPKRYPVMRNLDPVETKIENTLKNMLIEDKPLNNFWYKALQERTGLVEQTIKNYINESPTFKAIKDQGALSLKTRFNKPDSHKFFFF